MIGIKAEGSLEPIADELAKMTRSSTVVINAGSFDLLARGAVARATRHLLRVLSDPGQGDQGVRSPRPSST